uniref:Uncharacterized protein n=1 Tax=Cacopsylla melanoneura TaxID=428564 RepID=A0A8D9F4Y1_9HEMI
MFSTSIYIFLHQSGRGNSAKSDDRTLPILMSTQGDYLIRKTSQQLVSQTQSTTLIGKSTSPPEGNYSDSLEQIGSAKIKPNHNVPVTYTPDNIKLIKPTMT